MVPEKSGAWGWLLPAGSQRARSPEDSSVLYNVVEINPACLRLVGPTENVRGLGIVMTIMFSLMLLLIATQFILFYDTATRGYGEFLAFAGGGSLLGLFGLWRAYRAASAPMQYTAIISRRLRRIYAWSRKGGWISVDYDRAVPYICRFRLVAPTGASAPVFPLRVAELEPDSRRIARFVAPIRTFSSREASAGAWQFIRRYMDEDPAAVPPVVLVPDHRINAFAWMDRELFTDEIDRQHHPAGLFDGFTFWIMAGTYYLPNWMEYWTRRYGRRPPLPPRVGRRPAVGRREPVPHRAAHAGRGAGHARQTSPHEKALAARQHPGGSDMGRAAVVIRARDGMDMDIIIKLNPGNIDE